MNLTRFIKEHFLIIYLVDIVLLILSTVYFLIFNKLSIHPPIVNLTLMFIATGFVNYMLQSIFLNNMKEEAMIKVNLKQLGIYYMLSLSLFLVTIFNMLIINLFPYVSTFYILIIIDFIIGVFFDTWKFAFLMINNIKNSFSAAIRLYLFSLIFYLPVLLFLYLGNKLTVFIFPVLLIPTYIIVQYLIYLRLDEFADQYQYSEEYNDNYSDEDCDD